MSGAMDYTMLELQEPSRDQLSRAEEALGELARAIILRDDYAASVWWARWDVGTEAAAEAADAALRCEWEAAERAYYRTKGPDAIREMALALDAFGRIQDAEGI